MLNFDILSEISLPANI